MPTTSHYNTLFVRAPMDQTLVTVRQDMIRLMDAKLGDCVGVLNDEYCVQLAAVQASNDELRARLDTAIRDADAAVKLVVSKCEECIGAMNGEYLAALERWKEEKRVLQEEMAAQAERAEATLEEERDAHEAEREATQAENDEEWEEMQRDHAAEIDEIVAYHRGLLCELTGESREWMRQHIVTRKQALWEGMQLERPGNCERCLDTLAQVHSLSTEIETSKAELMGQIDAVVLERDAMTERWDKAEAKVQRLNRALKRAAEDLKRSKDAVRESIGEVSSEMYCNLDGVLRDQLETLAAQVKSLDNDKRELLAECDALQTDRDKMSKALRVEICTRAQEVAELQTQIADLSADVRGRDEVILDLKLHALHADPTALEEEVGTDALREEIRALRAEVGAMEQLGLEEVMKTASNKQCWKELIDEITAEAAHGRGVITEQKRVHAELVEKHEALREAHMNYMKETEGATAAMRAELDQLKGTTCAAEGPKKSKRGKRKTTGARLQAMREAHLRKPGEGPSCPVCFGCEDLAFVSTECGHYFCTGCKAALPSEHCPMCREKIEAGSLRKLYL